jgi:uncharacterized protein YecE (DUF72 family)
MSRVLVGTCSWSQHTSFYPDELPKNKQIAYYAQFFPIVEVDSTFYTLVAERNFALWAERTPPGFIFDVKPFRQLTWHDRVTPEQLTIDMFRQSLQPLRNAGKLGAITFQFPSWFNFSADNLDYLRRCRDEFASDRLSIEFRHDSWLSVDVLPNVLDFLRLHQLSLTVVDEPQIGSGSVPTVLSVTNPELTVVRFHGRNYKSWYKKVENTGERFNYLYSDEELAQWSPNVGELARQTEEVHLLFNNNRANYAVQNARRLTTVLQESLPEVEVIEPFTVPPGEPVQPPLL